MPPGSCWPLTLCYGTDVAVDTPISTATTGAAAEDAETACDDSNLGERTWPRIVGRELNQMLFETSS